MASTKNEQAHLETKIRRLREHLKDAVVVEMSSDVELFTLGRTAEVVEEESGRIHRWTLVGSHRGEPRGREAFGGVAGRRRLKGHRPGETVTVQAPTGVRRYRIARLLV